MPDPSEISNPEVRRLTRLLVDMQDRIDRLERGSRSTQLGRSSIDDGYLLFTQGGVVKGRAGQQVDGKFGWGAVNGDPPPRPNTPELVGTTAGFNVKWNGEFAGIKPSDFTYTIAYASQAGDDFIVGDSLIVGRLLGAGVIPVTAIGGAPIDPDTDYWVRLVSYNSSGVASEESFTAGPVQSEPVVATEILDGIVGTLQLADDAVTAAKIAAAAVGTAEIAGLAVDLSKLASGSVDATKIVDGSVTAAKVAFTAADIGSIATYSQASAPTGTIATGSLWYDSDDGNKTYRWTGSAWVLATDAQIAAALAAASTAQSDAAAALASAVTAQATADGKVDVFYQTTAPSSGMSVGDLWLDTDDSFKLYRYSGSAWVLSADQRIATALSNAATAQSTADGKITAFYQTAAPSTGMATGDLWYDTDNGNLPSRWNGTSWAALTIGAGAIGAGAVGSTQIAGLAVDLSKLAAGSVDASKLVADAVTAPAIATGAVGATEIAANAIIAGKISAGVVGATEIAANAIVAGKIAALAVTSGTVAANVIGTNELAANSVVAGKIAADQISSSHIVAGAIQASDLAADSVAAGKIAADAVTTRELAALSVVAGKIAANAIEAGHISAGAITADKLEAILVLASQIIAGDPAGWHLELGDSNTPILYWDGVNTGFALNRDQATGQSNIFLDGRIKFGSAGSQIESDYIDLAEQPASGFQQPVPRQMRHWGNSGPTSSVTAQWTSATQKGNLIVMAVWQTGTAGTTPNCGTPAGATIIDSQVSGLNRLTLFYVPNSPTSRTAETFGSSSGAAKWSIGLFEFTGIAAAPLDVQAFATGTGTVASTGTTGTTTQAAELQFAVVGAGNIGFSNSKGGQWTAPTNGFSKILEGDGTGGQGIAVATKTATGTGAASTALTANKSVTWTGLIATFKSAVAAGTPPTPAAGTLRMFSRSRSGFSTPHVIDNTGAIYPTGRPPHSTVKLNNDTGTLTGNTDTYAQGDWAVLRDPYSMAAIGGGGTFTNITIPVTGMWLVNFRAIFQQTTAVSDNIVAFVVKNTRAAANSIARGVGNFRNVNDASPVLVTRVVKLDASDILYWGTFAPVNYVVKGTIINIPTEISVTYLGPAD